MAKKTKDRREYVVGYAGDKQVVYGQNEKTITTNVRWCDRMTMFTAKQRAAQLTTEGRPVAVYRLVPEVVGEVRNGKFIERRKAARRKESRP